MKNVILFFFIFLVISCSTNSKKIITQESEIERHSIKEIIIPNDYDNLLQIDSIFEKIEVVPLETNMDCLIGSPEKILVFDNYFLIQDGNNQLIVFSITGEFIRKVGDKGRGPREFMELRDFDIDNKGHIYILDFKQILKYTFEGELVKKIRFEFSPTELIECNPLQFALCGENAFYIWGGSFGIRSNDQQNLFAMYKMNLKGTIEERYFPLYHKTVQNFRQFDKCEEYYNIIPVYSVDTIFKCSQTGVSANYVVDFGSKSLDMTVPNNFETLSEFKAEVDQKYANSIQNVIETDNWLYFTFNYKKYVKNVYYSKIKEKAFVSRPYPRLSNRVMPWMIHGKLGNDFIALVEPRILLEDLSKIEYVDHEVQNIKMKLENSSANDNHIVLICKLKKS